MPEIVVPKSFSPTKHKGVIVKPLSTLGYLQLAWLGKPACERKLVQLIKTERFKSVIEIGLGDGQRWQNILRVAAKFCEGPIRYTGIDEFDARQSGRPLKLIETHKSVKAYDAVSQLVPGTASQGIARIANSHLGTDLIVVSGEIEIREIESVLSFFPRMLHSNSKILLQRAPEQAYKELNQAGIDRWLARLGKAVDSVGSQRAKAA